MLSSAAANRFVGAGDAQMVSPCLTPLLILIFSLSLCSYVSIITHIRPVSNTIADSVVIPPKCDFYRGLLKKLNYSTNSQILPALF